MTALARSGVVDGRAPDDIALLADPALTAVIVRPPERPPWLDELEQAVVAGELFVERTTLESVSLDDFASWAREALTGAPAGVSAALRDDMAGILAQVMETARIGRVMVRVFTEAPTRRCGFHVDTVPPQAPTIGAVRVYNGATTEYVHGDDVLGTAEFYGYLAHRERLSREAARTEGAALGELVAMDERPSFLRPRTTVHRVPPDATVYFRHIDVRRHWSPHPVSDAWIHRSPMCGGARLVLNVSPAERARRRGPG
ncbi:hypothetical protein SRB5_10360 [Streptomyces sp. RB5]|uniref:Uncharacterized protein n=1 Tax=Streptomyces smaragdinus TaxID=2585196 RepID=A0A7K0CBZ1_9ACTN|nr:hypothetical protein [Streptomyces smaragdinus]MQY10923.1 hypothetical protein [Streptomyces smaragdinus]